MKISEGFFVIYQPKYLVPNIFDLHNRGLFKEKPSSTNDFGFRVLANGNFEVKLQCAWLEEDLIRDKKGNIWNYVVRERLLDLDDHLEPDPELIAKQIPFKDFKDTIKEDLTAWRNSYLPKEDSDFKKKLEQNIQNSIEEYKNLLRKLLVKKNQDLIMPKLPVNIQKFQFYIYPDVKESLFDSYTSQGGESGENRLIRHIVLLSQIFDSEKKDLFRKIDSGSFNNEEQAWECWTGFTGSKEESLRICNAMETVLRPFAEKMTA